MNYVCIILHIQCIYLFFRNYLLFGYEIKYFSSIFKIDLIIFELFLDILSIKVAQTFFFLYFIVRIELVLALFADDNILNPMMMKTGYALEVYWLLNYLITKFFINDFFIFLVKLCLNIFVFQEF